MLKEGTERSLAARAVRGGAAVAFSSYSTVVVGFAANLLMTRMLAPQHFGVVAVGTFFFGLINLRSKAGLPQAFAHRADGSGEAIGTLMYLEVATGALSVVVALVAAPLLLLFGYDQDVAFVLVALSLIGVVESVSTAPAVLLDTGLRFGRTSLMTAISLPLSYVPALIAAQLGAGYWSIVVQSAVQALILLVGIWWIARRELDAPWKTRWRFSRPVAKRMLRFGTVLGFSGIAALLVSNFDNFLVGTFVSLAALGFYDRAYRIASWPNMLVTNVIARTAFFTYAKLQNDPARLSKTLGMTIWIITSVALPLGLAIFAAAPDLVLLFYGPKWLPSVPYVRLLLTLSLVRPLVEDISGLLTAVGKPQYVSVMNWSMALLLVAIATPLTLIYQAEGTAIGVGIAVVVGAFVAYAFVRKTVALSLFDLLFPPAVATVCSLVLYLIVGRLLDWNTLPILLRMLVKTCVAVSVFYGVVVALQRQQFVDRVAYIWKLGLRTQ